MANALQTGRYLIWDREAGSGQEIVPFPNDVAISGRLLLAASWNRDSEGLVRKYGNVSRNVRLSTGGSLSRGKCLYRENPQYGKERAVRILLECFLV